MCSGDLTVLNNFRTTIMNSKKNNDIRKSGNSLIKPIPLRLTERANVVTTNNETHESNAIDSLKIPPPPQEPYKPKFVLIAFFFINYFEKSLKQLLKVGVYFKTVL